MSLSTATGALVGLKRMARTSELKSRGVTETELTRAVRSGEILRVRQGVYALPGTDPGLIHAAEHGGTLGCCAAGRLHGLWILDESDHPHIWLGRAGTLRRAEDCCRFHWDDGIVSVGVLPPVANVLLQIATCADEETFFAALESALRQNLLSPSGIAWLWKHLPIPIRPLLGFARSDADSGLESILRLRLHRLGIEARTQVAIRDVGEVDLVIDGWLIIEADGRENHDDVHKRHKDLIRDARAAARGFTTLRFDYALIVHDWATVEAAILGALEARRRLVA